MRRKRPQLRIVPDRPPVPDWRLVRGVLALTSGLVAGTAGVLALRWFRDRRRSKAPSEEAGVILAEVHSNGHSKARLGSLDAF